MAAGDSIQGFNKKALREIQDALDKLPKEFTVRRVQTILKKGLKPFIDKAIDKAPKKTGNLASKIGTKTFRNNKNYVFGGVLTGTKKEGERDGFYAKFLEYGFTHVGWPEKGSRIDKGTVHPSKMSEVPAKRNAFLRPAWDEAKVAVKIETLAVAEKRLQAYLKKVKKN